MSFAAKVAALRDFFGVPPEVAMPAAVADMIATMQLDGCGRLPAQVNALVAATGIVVGVAPEVLAPAAALVAAPAASPRLSAVYIWHHRPTPAPPAALKMASRTDVMMHVYDSPS